jgi:hypothetical protein
VTQGSVLSIALYNVYDTPQTPGLYLGLFAVDTCIYATVSKAGYVLGKLQRVIDVIELMCEQRNIAFNEHKLGSSTFLIDSGPLGLILN